MLDASVVICTHNPRTDHLARVLDALRNQTLSSEKWELLIVDNGSKVPLASNWDLSWHPNARHLVESELGLSRARRKGIQNAVGDVVIFVDDDNVLDADYLAQAVRIGSDWTCLGVWGSGSIRGEFEVQPKDRFLSWLPVRELTAARWSNLAGSRLFGHCPDDAIPWGAGLCARKEIAVAYSLFCSQSSIEITGRRGTSLIAGEDTEISFVCCGQGLGVGVFPELKMIHLIPKHRVSQEYIVRFAEGTCQSNFLLNYKWRQVRPQSLYSPKTLLTVLKALFLSHGVDRDLRFAWVRALAKANRIIDVDLRENTKRSRGQGGANEVIIRDGHATYSQSAHLS